MNELDKKLREILINFDELDYGSPDDGPINDAITKIKKAFAEEK
jgi:hypothetical protein